MNSVASACPVNGSVFDDSRDGGLPADVPMIHEVIDWRDKINFMLTNLTCGNYGPVPREVLDDLLNLSWSMNSRLYMEFMRNYNPR